MGEDCEQLTCGITQSSANPTPLQLTECVEGCYSQSFPNDRPTSMFYQCPPNPTPLQQLQLTDNVTGCYSIATIATDRYVLQVATQYFPNERPTSMDCQLIKEREDVDDLRIDWEIEHSLLGKHRRLGKC